MDLFMKKSRTRLMAVLNLTPDSLFDSVLKKPINLKNKIIKILEAGADIVDVGGESTAPGSYDISAAEEWARIEPALKILHQLKHSSKGRFEISLDSYKSAVLKKALA